MKLPKFLITALFLCCLTSNAQVLKTLPFMAALASTEQFNKVSTAKSAKGKYFWIAKQNSESYVLCKDRGGWDNNLWVKITSGKGSFEACDNVSSFRVGTDFITLDISREIFNGGYLDETVKFYPNLF